MGAGGGEVGELVVVGMGKLGGRELNVSSDIDLIFLYDEDGETQGGTRSLSNHEYFIRTGRRLINLLADVTGDGYVFRVDMRLRPNGDAGPLACSRACSSSTGGAGARVGALCGSGPRGLFAGDAACAAYRAAAVGPDPAVRVPPLRTTA